MARIASCLAFTVWLLHAADSRGSHLPHSADSIASDDECTGGGGNGADCAVSMMQLRNYQRPALTQQTSRVSRISRAAGDGGIELQSRFVVGSGASPVAECTGKEVSCVEDGGDGPGAVVYNSFGASGGGASWMFASFVIKDGPSPRYASVGVTITLALGLTAQNASWALSPCNIYVEGLGEPIEMPVEFKVRGSPECPPSYCLMAKPMGEGVPEQVSAPHCGFANITEGSALVQACPADGKHADLEFDITHLVKKGFLEFKVYASPTELIRGSFWQIPRLTVTSWGYTIAHPGQPK